MKPLYIIVFCSIVLCSCNNDEYKGEFAGTVVTMNGTGQPINIDGVKVQMSGLASKTTTTDNNGGYGFGYVPLGSYNFVYSKDGYPVLYINNVGLSGTGVTSINVILYYEPSTTTVTNFSVTDSSGYATLAGQLTPSVLSGINWIKVIIYMSTSPNLSSSNYVASYVASNNTDSTFKSKINLYDYFPSGSTVYLTAYTTYALYHNIQPFNFNAYIPSGYTNSADGKTIYSGLNSTPSNIVSVTLP